MSSTLSSKVTPEQERIVNAMKDQLIVALLVRLGGKVRVSVEELNGTPEYQLIMQADHATQELIYEAKKKDRSVALQKTL